MTSDTYISVVIIAQQTLTYISMSDNTVYTVTSCMHAGCINNLVYCLFSDKKACFIYIKDCNAAVLSMHPW